MNKEASAAILIVKQTPKCPAEKKGKDSSCSHQKFDRVISQRSKRTYHLTKLQFDKANELSFEYSLWQSSSLVFPFDFLIQLSLIAEYSV